MIKHFAIKRMEEIFGKIPRNKIWYDIELWESGDKLVTIPLRLYRACLYRCSDIKWGFWEKKQKVNERQTRH